MRVYGISMHRGTQTFLEGYYTLRFAEDRGGIPVFLDSFGNSYLGGYKSFYTVVDEVTPVELDTLVREVRNAHPKLSCQLSAPFDLYRTPMRAFVLPLAGISEKNRFDTYHAKTRNQVRKSLKAGFYMTAGKPSAEFYVLYENAMERLRTRPKPRGWFESFEKSFGDDVVCIEARKDGELVGANYCVKNGNYALLMYNVSDQRFWSENVNNRLYDETIVWAIREGITMLDFGPSTAGDERHNHFKRGFGAQERFLIVPSAYEPLRVVRQELRRFLKRLMP